MQMPATAEVVMVAGVPPVLAQKLRYYQDRNFISRVLAPAPCRISAISQANDWHMPATASSGRGEMNITQQDDGGRDRRIDHDLPERARVPAPDPEIEVEPDDGPQPELDNTLDTVRRAAALDVADDKTLPGF